MPNSLIDFGKYVGIMQNQAQLQMQRNNQDLRARDLDLEARRTAVNEGQLAINERSEQNARLNSIREIWQDPRVQNDEHLSNQLFGAIAPMVGIPTDGLQEHLTQSHKDRQDLMTATLGEDPRKAQEAAIKLMAGMPPEKQAVFLKNIEALPVLHGRAQIAQQTMAMNEAKFAELRQNQAIVNEGRGPLTALSSTLRDQLRGTDSPQFKAMQTIFSQTGHGGLLTSSDKTFSAKGKAPFQHLLDGTTAQLAQNLQPEIDRVSYLMQTDQRALEDMDHGVKQPGQMKEALTARIATNGPILGALRDLQDWYNNPLDKDRHAAAKSSYESIEKRRVELESMDKKLDTQRMNLANLANEKFDYKQGQDNAVALGQQEYFALPDKQRNGQAAAKIAAKITQDTGVPVKVSDITKDPNAPQSVTKIDLTQEKAESKKVGEGFGEQFITLQKADMDSRSKMAKYDRMDQLLKGMETGKLAPALTSVQAIADSLGMEVDKSLPAKQAFTALAGEIALSLRNPSGGAGMPGALSDRDLQFLQSMTPDLAKTTEGNKLIIGTARKLAQRDQEIAKIARDYRKKNGQLDEGFYDQLATYSEKKQLFSQQAQTEPGKAQPQSGPMLKALPQGAKQIGTSGGKPVYQSPDGKKWIGE